MAKVNKVLYNIDQRNDTTETEKKTARDNIGAGASNVSITHSTSPALPPVQTPVESVTIYDDGRLKFGNEFNAAIPTEPVQAQSGLILQASYAGSPARGFLNYVDVHSLVREVPASTAAVSGNVLTVDANGKPEWAASTQQTLPSHVANDALKVLTIDSSNNVVWGDKDLILFKYSNKVTPTYRDDPSGWQFEANYTFDLGATYKQYPNDTYAKRYYPRGILHAKFDIESASKTYGNMYYLLEQYYTGGGRTLVQSGAIQLVNSPLHNTGFATIMFMTDIAPAVIPAGYTLLLYTHTGDYTINDTIDVSCTVTAVVNDGLM